MLVARLSLLRLNMSQSLNGAAVAGMLRGAAELVIARESFLTKADQAVGDGDHGIGMTRGCRAALVALDKLGEAPTPKAAFSAVGGAILAGTGGAAGAVFGTFFRAAGNAIAADSIDREALALALSEGAKAVMARGKAKPGDKTMLDALLPAIESLRQAEASDFGTLVELAAAAARQGAEATANMVASMGRAKMLGERALGHPDPGALSVSFLFEGMASYLADSKL
jgi:dihydroxyacetone kinase-like protein